MFKTKVHNTDVEIVDGDITEMTVDAIVNAANSRLKHGGGVAGVIARKGGATIQEESDVWVKAWGGEVTVGSVVITSGGNLPAKYVIHAVGPRMGEGDEDEKLKKATLNSLQTAEHRNLKSIAFPAISTGVYGYPLDAATRIAVSTVTSVLESLDIQVTFVCFDDETRRVYERCLGITR